MMMGWVFGGGGGSALRSSFSASVKHNQEQKRPSCHGDHVNPDLFMRKFAERQDGGGEAVHSAEKREF